MDKQRFQFSADNCKVLIEKMDHYISKGFVKVGKVAKIKNPYNGSLKFVVTMEKKKVG